MKYLLSFIGIFSGFLSQGQAKLSFQTVVKMRQYGSPKGNDTSRYNAAAEAYVGRKANTYFWSDTSTTADDGVNVIQPTGTNTGRWIIASGQYVTTKGLLNRVGDTFNVSIDTVAAYLAGRFATPADVTVAKNAAATASAQALVAQSTLAGVYTAKQVDSLNALKVNNATGAGYQNSINALQTSKLDVTTAAATYATTGVVSANISAISRDSALIAANKAARVADSVANAAKYAAFQSQLAAANSRTDSLLAAYVTTKTAAAANTAAIAGVTTLANTAVQNRYLATGKDSIVAGSSTTGIVAFGAGGLSFPAGTLDSTKAIYYHQDGYYTGTNAVATLATATITIKLGNFSAITLDNVALAALVLGNTRNITVDGNITFVRSGSNFLPLFTGYVEYETVTQFTYQKRKYVALLGTAFNPTVTNDFSVAASITNATLIMKPAVLNKFSPTGN